MAQAQRKQAPEKTDIGALTADVGGRIRAARLERGMSLADLGGGDLSRGFLSQVERGRSRISVRALSIVADRLELPISYFLRDDAMDTAAELTLDRAERSLAQQRPDECLQLLETLTVRPQLRLRALLLRGRALVATGRAKDALPVLQEARGLAEAGADNHELALVLYYLGSALYATATFDEALTYFRHALGCLDPDDDIILVGKITVYLGHILFTRNDIDGALQHYARARDLFGSFGDLDALAGVYSGLSLAFDRKGDNAAALRYSKLSLGAYEAKQDARQAARELNNMAMKYRDLKDFDEALSCATQSVERATVIHAPEIEALAHSTLADIYLELDRAEDAAHEAEQVDRLNGAETTPAQITAWIVLAEVAERQSDHARADTLYQRALDEMERRGWYVTYAEKALTYTELLRRRGEIDRALDFALRAARVRQNGGF